MIIENMFKGSQYGFRALMTPMELTEELSTAINI